MSDNIIISLLLNTNATYSVEDIDEQQSFTAEI